MYVFFAAVCGFAKEQTVINIISAQKTSFPEGREENLYLCKVPGSRAKAIWIASEFVTLGLPEKLKVCLVGLINGHRVIGIFPGSGCHAATFCHEINACVKTVHFEMSADNILVEFRKV